MLIKPILDTAKRVALQKLTDYATENMSHGPAALSVIEPEISQLAVSVFEYQARFEEAQKVLQEDLITSADFTRYCIRAIPLSEVEGIDELLSVLKEIRAVSADIEARAIARARSQFEINRRKADEWRVSLERAERNNDYDRMIRNITSRLRGFEREMLRYETNMRAIDLRGDRIEMLLADIIGRLVEMKRQLLQRRGEFVAFARECEAWKMNRIEEGIY